ncbi:MAG: hypothetical protein PHW77_03155 [Eubacteriales bacterium]|nr:hypothetical protein [Eubacteriales bacterium]
MADGQCEKCRIIRDMFYRADKNPFKLFNETYVFMKKMYIKGDLNLYVSDCSFENMMEEVSEELFYTYNAYLQCTDCARVFRLGICIRGIPLYEVLESPPDINKIIQSAKRDGKELYFS